MLAHWRTKKESEQIKIKPHKDIIIALIPSVQRSAEQKIFVSLAREMYYHVEMGY